MNGTQLQLHPDTPPEREDRFTPEQSRAIEAAAPDLLLDAGAGTGKTRVLVERYCRAAEESGIDSVLAFTFTERAAAELRQRIRRELAQRAARAAAAGEAERAERLAAASRDTERAWISTIHGFCRRLLAAHPIALGLDPRFRVIDEPEAARVAARAFEQALEVELADGDRELSRLVAAFGVPGLRGLVRTAHDELRSLGWETPELPEPVAADPSQALSELVAAAGAALEEASEARGGEANLDRLADAAALDPRSPTDEATVAKLELSSSARAFSGPACDRYREAHRAARRALAERVAEPAYRRLAQLVRGFGRRFAELKEERSGLDFEDLQLGAVRLLRERPGIAATYRERFAHLMVDEFQDTNELQMTLVRLISRPGTHLFSVGDEFQSIYGFRHADLRVFRRRRDEAAQPAAQGELFRLSGNFRSRPEIVAAANLLGRTLLDGYRPITVGAEPAAARTGDTPAVELLLTPGGAEWEAEELGIGARGDYPSPPDRVAEARLVASRLRRLHEEGGVPLGEMVVLLRAFTHVAPFEQELRRAGLAPYVVGGRGYWSQQQVDDVRRLLGAVANPLDDLCLLGALASSVCAVLPDTLWLLRQAAGPGRHLWPTVERHFGSRAGANRPNPDAEDGAEVEEAIQRIPERDRERLSDFCATLAELRGDAPRVALEELIERAVTRFGYDLCVLMMPDGTRRLANVRKLMRMARRYELAEGRDLRGFLDHLAEAAASSDREGEAATAAEQHDGVRVMTVHAAKGLEFGAVAVADLGRGLLTGGRPPMVRLDRDDAAGRATDDGPLPTRIGIRLARFGATAVPLYEYDELGERAERDEAAESCRLAYVGATRARDHLILSGCFDPRRLAKPVPEEGLRAGTPVTERLLRELGIHEPADSVVEIPAPEPRPGLEARFEPGRIAIRVNRPDPTEFKALVPAPASEAEPSPPAPGRPPIPSERRAPTPAPGHLSYSALAAYGRCGYRFYAERILNLAGPGDEPGPDGEPSAAARRYGFGNAVHALLEWSARHGWRVPSEELCARLLGHERLAASDEERSRALAMVEAWLSSQLCAALREGGVATRPEMPFLVPLGGSVVRGTIDLLADTPDGPLVVDYKTDTLAGARPQELVDRYAVQSGIYALAAARPGTGVRTAFAFLDQGGEVVESELDAERLAVARAELELLVGGVQAGRFEVTDAPHRGLCHDCPARSRLCSHPPELTMRRRP